MYLWSWQLRELSWEYGSSLEGWVCSELWSHHCTPAWLTKWDPVSINQSIRELKTGTWTDICTLMFIVLLTRAKQWEQPKQCPLMNEWMSKIWRIHDGILFSLKRECDPDTCFNMMILENTMLRERNQAQSKDKCMISGRWGIWNSQTHRERK